MQPEVFYGDKLALASELCPSRDAANGSNVKVTGVVHGRLQLQEHASKLRCRVADLGSDFELILDEPWLVQHAAVLSYQTMTRR